MKKLIKAILTIFFAVTILFFLVRMAPGDPVEKILGPLASQEEILKYQTDLGLDQTLSNQYWNYLKGLLQGNFGNSLFKKVQVRDLLIDHFTPTFRIATISVIFSTFFGVTFGFLSGLFRNQRIDSVIRVVSLSFLALPIFSLAPILIYIFSIKLGLFPVSEWGEGKWTYSALPILTLTIPLASILTRIARNKYLEEVNGQWVKTLKGKGMGPFGVHLRLLKICAPTILNVVAIQLSVVLAGTMITETIFDIPGMGLLLFEGIQNRDYPVVQGVIIYSTLIYLLIYFFVDFLNERIDPRMRT